MEKELQEKREMAVTIAMQCLKMNSIGDSMKDGNGPAVFFELHGHVGTISIGVDKNGWEKGKDQDYCVTLYDFSDIEEYYKCMDYLESLEVEKMLENGMVLEMDRHLKQLEKEPVCPLCGALCETVYLDDNNNVAGCDNCFLDSFTKIDASEWKAKEDEAKEYERF